MQLANGCRGFASDTACWASPRPEPPPRQASREALRRTSVNQTAAALASLQPSASARVDQAPVTERCAPSVRAGNASKPTSKQPAAYLRDFASTDVAAGSTA